MRMIYTLPDQNIMLETVEMHLDKYFNRMGVPAGVIYLARPLYNTLLNTMFNMPRMQTLPLSKAPYVLHLTTSYGVVPLLCDHGNWNNEISFELSPDFEKEFEKILLGEAKK